MEILSAAQSHKICEKQVTGDGFARSSGKGLAQPSLDRAAGKERALMPLHAGDRAPLFTVTDLLGQIRCISRDARRTHPARQQPS